MDFHIATQKILLLQEQITAEDAQKKSFAKKMDAFGTLNMMASFLSKPKDDDFELVYQEHRYQPFWHILSRAHYVYDRENNYQFEVKGREVKKVTIEGKDFEVQNSHLHIPVTEHCEESPEEEVFIEGISGDKRGDLQNYLKFAVKEAQGENIQENVAKEDIIVPPKARVSAIMREMLSKMIQGIQADKIFEEKIEVACMDLYYRPVYAFQYRWKSKNKEGIIEVDAINGNTNAGSKTFKEFMGKALDRDFLFDVGADALGIFVPGGSIAVKVAKKYIDGKLPK
jgi:hypothetical protein